MNRVREHYEYLKSLELNVIAIFAQGSMNYGLYNQDNDYKSDIDTKAIVLPTLDDLIKGNKMKSTKYDFEGEQIDVKDIRVMMDMWTKSNPAYLEILFTKYKYINPEFETYINEILNMGDDIVKMNYPQLAKCMSGMSKEKVIAMEHPYPSLIDKIEKYGYDSKQLHHIIRLNRLITEVFLNDIPFGEALDISGQERFRNFLINVKKSKYGLEMARRMAVEYDEDTRQIKEQIIEKYKDFEFDSDTYNKLKNIIYELVKYNIIEQIKKEIIMKKKIFAVSDIHGHYDQLVEALNEAGYDENDKNNLLLVLGDHFDRGSQSLQVYDYLKRLTDEGKAITIMGNHDLMLIDYLEGTVLDPFNYFRNGESETFAEFLHETRPFESWCLIEQNIEQPTVGDFVRWLDIAKKQINEEFPELLPWLKSQPYYYETENYIFTHGAIDTKVEDWHNPHCFRYGYNDWDALTWDDGTFFGSNIKNTDKSVVIGHFGTDHLRNKYGLKKDDVEDFSILKRKDGKVIAIDATTAYSKKVNVLVIESEEILDDVEERR